MISLFCMSPIFDLNVLRVAARMAACAAARELSSVVINGTNPCLYAAAIRWPTLSTILVDLIK